jgi:hypothetical protein
LRFPMQQLFGRLVYEIKIFMSYKKLHSVILEYFTIKE